MFVNQPDDAQLVALWDDPETCPAIARRLGVSQTWLTLQWRRLRQQDRLPTDRRRNASERRVDESSDGADGRPDLKKCDRLLRRLIAVHGEPRFDLFVPATSSSQLARMKLLGATACTSLCGQKATFRQDHISPGTLT